ncbi:MAG: DNA polymerase III subunit chi [Rhodospirillales bacterium 69-11]|nr:DNA polymerase III subunit chi [Rhodospirillales bacterium]MBN8925732.1 DNA polymerase III subunit chi [Rhodospirillales bacterium]OJW21845.1 MAG: DNA polymerase III subunit chi [Rhodospirillales bacterium 69-11]
MAQVGFYHLTRTGVAQALPQLLGRTLAAGERALVLCRTEATVATLDRALWEVAEPDWLPHGTAADGDADLQPIWLSVEDAAPNGARFLFLTEGAETARLEAFTRVFDLFDGTDEEAVAAARTRWKAVRAGGHEATYWRQGERGWERGG